MRTGTRVPSRGRASGVSLALAMLLIGCQAAPQASSEVSADATPTPSPEVSTAPSASANAEPAETPASSPSPAPAAVGRDSVVATTVEALTLRERPGTDGEQLGILALGTEGFVTTGPEEIDGVPWYRLSGMGLPWGSGCVTLPPDEPIACPAFEGWVAGANPAGDPWLEPTDPGCPAHPSTLEEVTEVGYTLRLACWSGSEITLRAWWPPIPAGAGLGGACLAQDHPAGFLLCQNINYNGVGASEDEDFFGRLLLSIDPASGVTMPDRGQWIEVTGHFDDPAAQLCHDPAMAEHADIDAIEFRCRLEFVPTSVTPSSP